MQIVVRTIIGFAVGVLAFGFLLTLSGEVARAAEEPLTDEQKSHIRSECAQIKGSLNQLHASDALLRVNRGQVYEAISSKLMSPFNSRLGSAGFDNKAMATHTAQYAAALADFRADYIQYEQKVSSALKVDCQQQPQQFYKAIIEARELRKSVHGDVQRLHRVMSEYGTSVNDFLLNFKRLGE